MSKNNEQFTHSRWHDNPFAKPIKQLPLSDEQIKRQEKFDKDFAKFLEQRKKKSK